MFYDAGWTSWNTYADFSASAEKAEQQLLN